MGLWQKKLRFYLYVLTCPFTKWSLSCTSVVWEVPLLRDMSSFLDISGVLWIREISFYKIINPRRIPGNSKYEIWVKENMFVEGHGLPRSDLIETKWCIFQEDRLTSQLASILILLFLLQKSFTRWVDNIDRKCTLECT